MLICINLLLSTGIALVYVLIWLVIAFLLGLSAQPALWIGLAAMTVSSLMLRFAQSSWRGD